MLEEDTNENIIEVQTMTQHQAVTAEPTFRSAISVPVLRRRAAAHPMGLFSVAATVAILSIAMPWPGASLPAASEPASSRGADAIKSPKPIRSEIDLACEGQVWGRETPTCLLAIAKDGGKDISARIRTISGA
jgi:hypothetical protein